MKEEEKKKSSEAAEAQTIDYSKSEFFAITNMLYTYVLHVRSCTHVCTFRQCVIRLYV